MAAAGILFLERRFEHSIQELFCAIQLLHYPKVKSQYPQSLICARLEYVLCSQLGLTTEELETAGDEVRICWEADNMEDIGLDRLPDSLLSGMDEIRSVNFQFLAEVAKVKMACEQNTKDIDKLNNVLQKN